jgi:hypothetical protein
MKKHATFFGFPKVHKFITLLFTGLAFSTGAFAASVTFNGTTNTDWATATNWSSGTVPTSADVITIAADKSVVIAIATTVSVEKITLNAGAGLTNNGTLTIAPGLNSAGATTGAALVIFGNNTFDNEGTLTITSAYQTSATFVIYILGTGNTFTFNGTNTLAAVPAAGLFYVNANATATIGGAGFTIGNATTYPSFDVFKIAQAGASLTINNGTILNVYTNNKVVFTLQNTGSVINNGTINCYTTGTSGNAIQIWQTTASVNATFKNNGTLLMSGFEQPAVFGGSNTGSTGYTKFENTGTVTSTYPGISSGTSTGTIGIYSSMNLPNVITNSGTMNLNASFRSIFLNAKAYGGSFTNTGTINIAKGIIASGGTSGAPSTYQTIDNNSGGMINFNYGVSAGTIAATNSVVINNNSGATINGSCTFAASTLVTTAGSTLSPGDYTAGVSGIGKMILTPANGSFTLSGNVNVQVNGKTTDGTDYDQIAFAGTCALTLSGSPVINLTVGYSPAYDDRISVINSNSLSGSLGTSSLPTGWATDYASADIGVKYLGINTALANQDTKNNVITVEGRIINLHGAIGVVNVFNSVGRLVVSEKTSKQNIELKNKGIYLIKLETAQGIKVQKVLVN